MAAVHPAPAEPEVETIEEGAIEEAIDDGATEEAIEEGAMAELGADAGAAAAEVVDEPADDAVELLLLPQPARARPMATATAIV